MSDPWTDAWVEAEVTAPPAVLIYDTLELQHAVFVDSGTPFAVRVVAGATSDVNLTIEDGALFNGGETVAFQAVSFTAERPSFEEGKIPESQIIIDHVARELTPYLEDATKMRADFTIVYRQYLSSDTSAPCYGPVEFNLKRVKVNGTRVTGLAKLDDLSNKKFPKKIRTIKEYPGLLP